jgi:hypothetical protein
MNITLTPHGRIALLDPWEADRAEETEGSPAERCAREVQWQPAGEDASYGCVEWYLYSEFARARDATRAH